MQNRNRPLARLKRGQVGMIQDLIGLDGSTKRLADLGFLRGREVEMVRPGATCIVRLGRATIAMGNRIQHGIVLNDSASR